MASTKGKQLGDGRFQLQHDYEQSNAGPPSYNEVSHQAGPSHAQTAAAAVTDSKNSQNFYNHHELSNKKYFIEARPSVGSPLNFPPAHMSSTPTPTSASTPVETPYSNLPEVVTTVESPYTNLPEVVTAETAPSSPAPSSSLPTPQNTFNPFNPYSPSLSNPYNTNPSSQPTTPSLLLAIPQTKPTPTSPFPQVQAPNTLKLSPTPETFTTFLGTLSSLLSASASERAKQHMNDVGRNINSIPRKLGRDTTAHVRDVGRSINSSAKKGNFITASVAALAGTVSIPVAAALRVVDASLYQLPVVAVGGLSRKPLTPRARADAFVAEVQRDWFRDGGVRVLLCDTAELMALRGGGEGTGLDGGVGNGSGQEEAVRDIVNLAHRTWEQGPSGQLEALHREFGFAPLQIEDSWADRNKPLEIGPGTLWLVIMTDAVVV